MRHRIAVYAIVMSMTIILGLVATRRAGADDEERNFYEFMRNGRAPEALDIAEKHLFAVTDVAELKQHTRYSFPFVDTGMLGHIAFVKTAEPFIERFRSEIRRQPENLDLRLRLIALLYANRNSAEADIEIAKLFVCSETDTAYYHQFASGILAEWNRPGERIRHLRAASELPVNDNDLAEARYITARFMSPAESLVRIKQRRLCELGDALMADGEWAQAWECYNKANTVGSDFAKITDKQINAALAAIKDAESRIAKLEKLIDPRRGDIDCAVAKADLLLRTGQIKEAADIYRIYSADHLLPFNPHVHAGLAEAYARLGRTEEAIAEYQIALDLTPVIAQRPWLYIEREDFCRWMCRLEELCQAAGNPQAMIDAYEKERRRLGTEASAARLSQVNARIRLNLWRTTVFMFKTDRAADVITLWAQWCRLFPDDAAQAVAQAVNAGVNPDTALVPFSAARADREWRIGASIATASILQSENRADEAKAILARLGKTLPTFDTRRLIVADMLNCQGDARGALEAIHPLARNPEYQAEERVAALRMAIRLAIACGETTAAVADSEELLRLYPDDMNARRLWAAALTADGRPLEWWGITQEEVERHKAEAKQKEAARDLDGALAIHRRLSNEARPSDGLLALRAAELCRAGDDIPGEIAWLQRARMIDLSRFSPAGLPLPDRLAEFYRTQNDIKNLASLELRNQREVGDKALFLARHGYLTEALAFLEDITANAPDDYPAYMNRQALLRLYLDAGRTEEAHILCQSLFDSLMGKQKFNASHGLILADAFGRLGEYDKALTILEHTEELRERNYDDWIEQARDRLKALKKLAHP